MLYKCLFHFEKRTSEHRFASLLASTWAAQRANKGLPRDLHGASKWPVRLSMMAPVPMRRYIFPLRYRNRARTPATCATRFFSKKEKRLSSFIRGNESHKSRLGAGWCYTSCKSIENCNRRMLLAGSGGRQTRKPTNFEPRSSPPQIFVPGT